MNVTVCLTQSTTASFTCVVDTRGIPITSVGWQILDGGIYIPVIGRDRHMSNVVTNGDILTDTLTVINVSVNDNGALYQCEPIRGVTSVNANIIVLGEIIIVLLSYAYV